MVALKNYKLSFVVLFFIYSVVLISGCTPKLSDAIWKGDIDQTKILINNGANVNEVFAGYSVLSIAVERNQIDIVRLLLDKGAYVNESTVSGQTPLKIAMDNNNAQIVELLLSKGAKPNALNISLNWIPSIAATGFDPIDTSVLRKIKFSVGPFIDTRKNKEEIGRNIESDKSIKFVTTNNNVAQWLADKFTQVLREFDITTVQNSGDLIIESDILKFYVTESTNYKTDIALNIKLRSRDGKVIWQGMIIGSDNRWGRSFKKNSYQQGLSNACIDLVYNMLKNEQVRQVVKE